MRNLVIGAVIATTIALGGLAAWQARAAALTAPVPHAGPYTPIHPAACGGRDVHCGPGAHWVCGGGRCWCAAC